MAALSGTADLSQLPATKAWLKHANATESIMKTKKIDKPENYIMENVLMQIKNLKTHPPVAAALKTKKLKIYAWVYDFEHGDVLVYEKNKNSFVSTAELDMGKLELCEL